MRISLRRTLASFIGLGLVISAPTTGGASAPDPTWPAPPGLDQGDVLGKHDTALLAAARTRGERTIGLLVIADAGRTDQVADGVAELGGTVGFREDSVDYLRVEVPIAEVGAVAGLRDVAAVDVEEVLPIQQAPGAQAQLDPLPQRAPNKHTARSNPYLPTQDVGTAQFTNVHPTWDGRGVRIAVIDTGVDLHHPALQKTSTGDRKIVDWVTATDPSFVNGVNADDDPTWIQMATDVEADPTFDNGAWTAPAPGTYRFGTFNERDPRLGGELANDVDRDGNPAGSSGLFGVLWDRETGSVYVDLDQDRSFADEAAMTDYQVNHDVGYFGTDDTTTPVREAVPFVVQTSEVTDAVNIGLVSGAQGTHVAGVAAGNDVFGGKADGAAPGAEVVSVRACLFVAGCTNHALAEGMIYAARDGDADIITMSIGDSLALNDGNNARAELYDSLIDTYGVQIVLSAGDDGPGVNTAHDPAVASKALAVGSYVSRKTRLSNYGVVVDGNDHLDTASSAGPREDGGFKPELVAPGSAVSTIPTWQAGQPVPGTFALPPGLGTLDGTVVATPQVAGAAAVLVSAAEASQGVSWTPATLRLALRSSARFLNGYATHRQGNGLLNTNAAWQVLLKQPQPVEITTAVETHTLLSGFLKTPGVGTGIYDREGVTVGDTYTRTYTFTRTTGPAAATNYVLSWTGNDGTFAPKGRIVRLPLGQPVEVPVTIRVTAPGVHSAILNLNNSIAPGIEHRTLNTVVAPHELDGSQELEGTVERGETQSYFFRVPLGATSLGVDLTSESDQVRLLRYHPYGTPVPGTGPIADPTPGVWEFVVAADPASDLAQAAYSLTVAGLGVTISPDPDVIASLPAGTPTDRSYTVTNTGGAFVGRATGGTLGSAHRATPTIAEGTQSQFPVTVTPGATQLRATISDAADPAADLDLSVFSCVTGSCELRGQSSASGTDESVTINNPAPGAWVVLVDAVAVPEGTTTFDYVDVVTNPAYGAITVADSDAPRPPGASWPVTGTITAAAPPPPGRVLLGSVRVVTDTGVLVGANEVIVEAVP